MFNRLGLVVEGIETEGHTYDGVITAKVVHVRRHPNADKMRLIDVETTRPWVLKVDGRYARRQPLQLGLRSGGLSEVLEGLQAGDLVVPAAADLRDGSRLRPVPDVPAH